MGWLIAVGVLTLLAILPVGVSAFYDADGPLAYATVGPIRIRLYPGKEKVKSEKKDKKSKKKDKPSESSKKAKSKKGGSLQEFLPLVDYVLDFLSAFKRKLRITRLEMKLLMPLLERAFVIKKRDLEVECDFLAEKTLIAARADISITLGRILSLLLVQGIPVLRELLKIMNKRKGGAKA